MQPSERKPVTSQEKGKRMEEIKLNPCPLCGVSPTLGYACGEYFIFGQRDECPCCGVDYTTMYVSEEMMIESWEKRIPKYEKQQLSSVYGEMTQSEVKQ